MVICSAVFSLRAVHIIIFYLFPKNTQAQEDKMSSVQVLATEGKVKSYNLWRYIFNANKVRTLSLLRIEKFSAVIIID